MKNFLTNQYKKDNKMQLSHSYLIEQFSDYKKILNRVSKVIRRGDYTLGDQVNLFEKKISKRMGAKYTISVGNGTDALFLALKAFDIGHGDEVITTPYTFIATIGSIVTSGAKPVFVDIKDDYNIDEKKIEKAITRKTKAIMPVHWAGRPCELDKIKKIAKKYKLKIIQDSCHCIDARYKSRHLVEYGDICTFSLHPLKNLNVWGDGGFMLTQDKKIADKLFLLRNHGLVNRDTCKYFGFNSRLDTIQAVVGNYKLENKLNNITKKRISNALLLDKLLKKIKKFLQFQEEKELKKYFIYTILILERIVIN